MSTPPPAAGPTEPTPGKRTSLLRHRDFRLLWTGDAVGQVGAQLTGLAIPVLAVSVLGATPWQMGLLDAAQFAAYLVIGLPAGAWVDRMRKRRVIVVADLLRASALLGVVLAAWLDLISIPLLIVAALVVSAASLFYDVAHQSYIPELVGLEHVVEGNAKLQTTASVAHVAGPALGGQLLRFIAPAALIGVNAVLYLLSALVVTGIRKEERPPSRQNRQPLLTEIREGLAFVVTAPILRRIVATTAISNFFGTVAGAVQAIFILRTLGISEAGFGAIFSAGAIGGLVGAAMSERLARWFGGARLIPISAIAFTVGAALVPLTVVLPFPPAPTLMAAMAIGTFTVVVYNVAQVSYRQRLCPPRLLGRMNASIRFIVWGVIPIGAVIGGALGTVIGIVPTLWVGVIGGVLASAPVVFSPMMRMRELLLPDHSE